MKRWFLHIFFLIGQLGWSFGQDIRLELLVSPDRVAVDQTIKITLKSNEEGDIIEKWPAEFVKMNQMQSSWQYMKDAKTNGLKQEHSVIFSGSFTHAGDYQLGPFLLKVGNKTYASNTLTVTVFDKVQKKSRNIHANRRSLKHALGLVEISKAKLYEGEPLVVRGKVYAKEQTSSNPILKRNFELQDVSDAYLLPNKQAWEATILSGESYYSFIFNEQVVFPIADKSLLISPFEMYLPYGFHGVHIRSSTPEITVLPLPTDQPDSFIGGVGEFDITQRSRTESCKKGDIIEIEVVISGIGNLHAIETPKLMTPTYMTKYGDVQKKENFIFSSQGSQGEITFTYPIQITRIGTHLIQPITIAYFHPRTKRYIIKKAQEAIRIQVTDESPVEMSDWGTSKTLADISSDHYIARHSNQSDNTKKWLWYVGSSLFFMTVSTASILLFIRQKKRKAIVNQERIEQSCVYQTSASQINDYQTITDGINQLSFYLSQQQIDKFYLTLEKTLIASLKFKTQQPSDATISRHELMHLLRKNNDPSLEKVKILFQSCDYARYGHLEMSVSPEQLFEELKTIL